MTGAIQNQQLKVKVLLLVWCTTCKGAATVEVLVTIGVNISLRTAVSLSTVCYKHTVSTKITQFSFCLSC